MEIANEEPSDPVLKTYGYELMIDKVDKAKFDDSFSTTTRLRHVYIPS